MTLNLLPQLGLLIFVAALVAMLSRRLDLPYTVGLVLAGIGLSLLPLHLNLQLSKELIFSVFLPPLIFEAALHIHWKDLRTELPVVVLLATAGLVLAAAVTAVGMHYSSNWEWGSACVFGVLIAATDPVSVIATFKEADVRGRLRLLVESESLLNDGTAAVAFVVALSFAMGLPANVGHAGGHLVLSISGGILSGALVGFGLMLLSGRTTDPLVEITFTTLAAYGSFLLAEQLHCSGVLATLTAGVLIGSRALQGAVSAPGRVALESFWEYAAFLANSLIFLLIGAREAQQHFGVVWRPALAAIVLVTLGRAVAIYPFCALFVRTRLKVDLRHQHILFWGGLRGALALALALGLPQDLPHRDELVAAALAVVAFSVFVQGLTMTPLLRRLGQLPDSRPEAPTPRKGRHGTARARRGNAHPLR